MDTAPFTLEITQDAPAVFHAPSCSGSLDLRLGDCMDGMKTFPDGHFDLAIVDPPYGIGYEYDTHDDSSNLENDELVRRVFELAPPMKVWTCGMRIIGWWLTLSWDTLQLVKFRLQILRF